MSGRETGDCVYEGSEFEVLILEFMKIWDPLSECYTANQKKKYRKGHKSVHFFLVFSRHFFLLVLLLSKAHIWSQPLTKTELLHVTEASVSPNRLGVDDIRPTVEKMLENQSTDRLSEKQLAQSFQFILQKFDPHKIYMLQSEVAHFGDRAWLQHATSCYNKGSFTPFQELLKSISTAIERARKWRLEVQWGTKTFPVNENSYAVTLKDLQARHANFFLTTVFQEKPSQSSFRNACKNVDKQFYRHEEQFLLQGSQEQQEEQFAQIILRAISSTFDAHTATLTQQEADLMRLRLEKESVGIGIFLVEVAGTIRISHIVKGSPADRDKSLRVGDQIVAIDKQPLRELSLQQVEKLLPKIANERVVLEIATGSGTRVVLLEAQKYEVEEGRLSTLSFPFRDGEILFLELPAFYGGEGVITATNEIRHAVERVKKEGKLYGIVLDIRANRGGFLAEAITTGGLFIDTGVVVATKNAKGQVHYYRDLNPGVIFRGPFIILTSRATASAAEIVAAALKEYGVALIVGDETTYGKGSVQLQNVAGVSERQQTDSAAAKERESAGFKVTVGTYHAPSGRSTQIEGVKADIVVPSPWGYDTKMSERELLRREGMKELLLAKDIPAAFNDRLQDVDPADRVWFEHFYLPHLEKQKRIDPQLIALLRQKSEKRLHESAEYQLYIQKMATSYPLQESDRRKVLDLQRDEALSILKDWIVQVER